MVDLMSLYILGKAIIHVWSNSIHNGNGMLANSFAKNEDNGIIPVNME